MQLRGVLILEKLYKAKYILRIKYKIPFSSKFKKNNIPCKLNTEIRFLELSIWFNKSFESGKLILKTLNNSRNGPEERGGPFHKVSFSCPTCRLSSSSSRSTASYRIGNEAPAHHESSPLVLLLFHQIPEGSQGRRRDGQRGKGSGKERQSGRWNWMRKWRLRARASLFSSSLNFCGCFLQLHLPFPNHWSQMSRTTSYRFVTSCVEHEDNRPCIRIRRVMAGDAATSYQATPHHRPKKEKRGGEGGRNWKKGELKRAIGRSV